jgi:hypothetical protein
VQAFPRGAWERDAERQCRHSHAERGNETRSVSAGIPLLRANAIKPVPTLGGIKTNLTGIKKPVRLISPEVSPNVERTAVTTTC